MIPTSSSGCRCVIAAGAALRSTSSSTGRRENRSQFVFTKARGRDVIFWQSARTAKQARPNVAIPTARAAGQQLEIIVDVHERYPWKFGHQQSTTVRRTLPAGDYAVAFDDRIVAAVERAPPTRRSSTA